MQDETFCVFVICCDQKRMLWVCVAARYKYKISCHYDDEDPEHVGYILNSRESLLELVNMYPVTTAPFSTLLKSL